MNIYVYALSKNIPFAIKGPTREVTIKVVKAENSERAKTLLREDGYSLFIDSNFGGCHQNTMIVEIEEGGEEGVIY